MATEQQKQAALAHIEARAQLAEENGLHSTARSWRDYYACFIQRPAEEIIIADTFGSFGKE